MCPQYLFPYGRCLIPHVFIYFTACQINLLLCLIHRSLIIERHGLHSCMCVCLILDDSVANMIVGVRGGSPPRPIREAFGPDVAPPGRPLLRSQSFHYAPGKGPPALPPGPRRAMFKNCYDPLGKR